MAELAKMVTWTNDEDVTPQDDALIYETAIPESGFFYGGEVTRQGSNTLHVASAHGVIRGRKFTITEGDVVIPLTSSGTLRGRLYLHADLSNAAAPLQLLYETGTTLSPEIQEETFNITNGVWDMNIATFEVTEVTIRNVSALMPKASNANNEGIAPNPMKSKKISIGDGKLSITFTPPDDTVIEGSTLCYVGGVKLVRKEGVPPTTPEDGTLILDLDRDNMRRHVSTPYIDDGLLNGTTYFYKFFPYSQTGVINVSDEAVSGTPQPYVLYGFRIDKNDANPATRVTYTDMNADFTPAFMNFTTGRFDYGSWDPDNIFFLRNNLPYMVRSNGQEDYQLDPNDLTKKSDGTSSDIANTAYDGNAMAKMETVWLYQYEEGQYQYVKICNIQLSDQYKAYAHEREDGSIMDHIWLAIYPGALLSGKVRSLSGQALMNGQTGANELTYAKANGSLWSTRSWAHRNLINMLLVLMGRSTNTQAVFGNGHTSGGSQASHLYRTGRINDKGRFYGTSGEGDVRVFFLDQYWGDQYERIEGCGTNAAGNIAVKMKKPYNTSLTGYTDTGIKPAGTSGGYQNADQMTMNGLIPKTASGSATTYTADGLWWAANCYAIVGGTCADGALDGAFCLSVNSAVSRANWYIGAALSCEQPV